MLTAAKAAYAVGAVTQPAGDSAADRYRAVLKMRPNQPEARAGMERIVNVLVTKRDTRNRWAIPSRCARPLAEIARAAAGPSAAAGTGGFPGGGGIFAERTNPP